MQTLQKEALKDIVSNPSCEQLFKRLNSNVYECPRPMQKGLSGWEEWLRQGAIMSWLEHAMAVRLWPDHVSIMSRSCLDHVLIRSHSHTHFGPLPQPLLPATQFFLHCSWAFLGITIQPFEQFFTTWMAYNLLECLFLNCLHPYAPPKGACIVPPCCNVSSFLAT
jgi:hypothetical protein